MHRRPALPRAAFLNGLLPAAAVLAGSRAVRAAAPPSLRVAVAPADTTAQILYAVDRGMFAAAGLDLNLSILQNSAAIVSAVVSGAIDIGASDVSVIANANQRGLRLRYTGTGSVYSVAASPTNELVVAKDSPISSGADGTPKDRW